MSTRPRQKARRGCPAQAGITAEWPSARLKIAAPPARQSQRRSSPRGKRPKPELSPSSRDGAESVGQCRRRVLDKQRGLQAQYQIARERARLGLRRCARAQRAAPRAGRQRPSAAYYPRRRVPRALPRPHWVCAAMARNTSRHMTLPRTFPDRIDRRLAIEPRHDAFLDIAGAGQHLHGLESQIRRALADPEFRRRRHHAADRPGLPRRFRHRRAPGGT